MSAAPLKFAVIGAGVMGANHARNLKAMPEAELVAVVDADLAKATAAIRGSGAMPFARIEDLDCQIDAAVIALPTAMHLQAAKKLAGRGVHLLVEKPIALTLDEADDLIETAAANEVCLAVGHIERFNAAVVELAGLLDEPLHIEASRISPYSPRISDGVILDLMIHDLDIVCSLVGDHVEPEYVCGVARKVRSDSEDMASVTIQFSNGVTAVFNTSRLGQEKTRTIEITQAESSIRADLVRQDITIHKMARHEYLSDEGVRYRQSSVLEIPFIETRGEPLQRELASFIAAARSGSTPVVDGHAARRALALALRATQATTQAERRAL